MKCTTTLSSSKSRNLDTRKYTCIVCGECSYILQGVGYMNGRIGAKSSGCRSPNLGSGAGIVE